MKLHRRGDRADWDKVRAARRTSWQRLAKASHGVLTPANLITVAGFLLVALGCYLLIRHKYSYGIAAIVVGRLADIADGIVAERTKTKSSLGEIMDAGLDKVAMLLLLLALIDQHLIPLVLLGIVLLQNAINVVVALLAKSKGIELQPSAHGKITVAATWMSLVTFAAATVAGRESLPTLHSELAIIASVLALIFVVFGFISSKQYAQLVFSSMKYNPHRNLIRELSRIIIVVNPQSTNVHRIEKRGNELHKLFPDKTIALVETSFRTAELSAKLKKQFNKKPGITLVCIGGGDGTVHAVINALMQLAPAINLAKTPILPLWGGNANDLAYMLNGVPSRSSMRILLGRGKIVPVHPFEIITQCGDHKETRYAACYASFGASAYAASELEKPAARREKIQAKSTLSVLVHEINRFVRAILEAPGFAAEQEGQRIKIFDQIFANGSRMGKLDHLPVRLHERKFYWAVKSEKQPTFWFYVLWLLRGERYGVITDKTSSFTTKERAWAQFDGEATSLPRNTTVTIGHAKTPFYAISTKLRP